MYRPPATEVTKEHCCAGCGRPFIDTSKRIFVGTNTATIDGVEYRLTVQRCDLLRLLVRAAGETVHYETIYQRLWGADGDVEPKAMAILMSLLRKHLNGAPISITPEYGVGYRLTVEPKARTNAGTENHRTNRHGITQQRASGHGVVAQRGGLARFVVDRQGAGWR